MKPMLFFGGPILTMDGPERPQAVLVKEGRIAQVGTLRDCVVHAEDAVSFDLQGRALLPAFLDPHSHLTALANTLRLAALEGAKSFDEIAERADRLHPGEPRHPRRLGQRLRLRPQPAAGGAPSHPRAAGRGLRRPAGVDRPRQRAHGAANSAALRALASTRIPPTPRAAGSGGRRTGAPRAATSRRPPLPLRAPRFPSPPPSSGSRCSKRHSRSILQTGSRRFRTV